MRTRLATIAALSFAALIGTAAAAHAVPQGPGDMSDKPTTTTAPPKGPDKVAPKPTPTTVAPKGPGDVAQPQPGDNPTPPKGPGDLAQPSPGPVVDPAPPTTPGDDEGTTPATSDDALVQGKAVETVPVADSEAPPANDPSSEAAAAADGDNGVSPLLWLGVAAAVAGLIGLAAATRRRDVDERGEQL